MIRRTTRNFGRPGPTARLWTLNSEPWPTSTVLGCSSVSVGMPQQHRGDTALSALHLIGSRARVEEPT